MIYPPEYTILVAALRQDGVTVDQMVTLTGKSQPTVYRWLARIRDDHRLVRYTQGDGNTVYRILPR